MRGRREEFIGEKKLYLGQEELDKSQNTLNDKSREELQQTTGYRVLGKKYQDSFRSS